MRSRPPCLAGAPSCNCCSICSAWPNIAVLPAQVPLKTCTAQGPSVHVCPDLLLSMRRSRFRVNIHGQPISQSPNEAADMHASTPSRRAKAAIVVLARSASHWKPVLASPHHRDVLYPGEAHAVAAPTACMQFPERLASVLSASAGTATVRASCAACRAWKRASMPCSSTPTSSSTMRPSALTLSTGRIAANAMLFCTWPHVLVHTSHAGMTEVRFTQCHQAKRYVHIDRGVWPILTGQVLRRPQ